MDKDKEYSIAEEHLQKYVIQAISALESILIAAKTGHDNYLKTGEGITDTANRLAKDIMWFVPNRCPDLLTYAQRVVIEYEERAKQK